MANEITTARQQFQTALEAQGLRVSEFVPERVTPPLVIINTRSPYLEAADFGEYSLNLELMLVASTGTNKQTSEKLDQLIQDVLEALAGISWVQFESVGQPYELQVNNAGYLSSNISVVLQITI